MMEDVAMKATDEKLDISSEEKKDDASGEDIIEETNKSQEEQWTEGHLLKLFKLAAEKCIDKCLIAKQLARCHKQIWKNNKEVLQSLFEQVFSQTKERVQDELNSVIEQENLPKLLSEMDAIMNESRTSDAPKAWRPSGNPEDDTRAHIIAKKLAFIQNLEQQYHKTQQEETKLKEKVQEKRNNLSDILSQIQSFVDNSKASSSVCVEFEVENENDMLTCRQKIDYLQQHTKDNNNSVQMSSETSIDFDIET